MRRRWVALLAAVVGTVAVGGCRWPDGPAADDGWFVGILLDGTANVIAVGDTVALEALAAECDLVTCPRISSTTAPERFRWHSTNPDVIEVTAGGLLRAQALGKAVIEVKLLGEHGGRSNAVQVETVMPIRAVTLRLSRDSVQAGDTLSATFAGVDAKGRPVAGAGLRFSYYPTILAPLADVPARRRSR